MERWRDNNSGGDGDAECSGSIATFHGIHETLYKMKSLYTYVFVAMYVCRYVGRGGEACRRSFYYYYYYFGNNFFSCGGVLIFFLLLVSFAGERNDEHGKWISSTAKVFSLKKEAEKANKKGTLYKCEGKGGKE